MTTALQIITGALSALGVAEVGQPLEAADAELGRERLNELLGAWATESLYGYTTSEAVYTMATATSSLTIGTGMQINVTRPVSLLAGAYVRSAGQDYPLDVIDRATYAAIGNKTLGGGPGGWIHYDGNGVLYLYPAQTGELHLPLRTQLSSFASLAEDKTLPQGYARALRLTLAEELAPDFNREVSPTLARRAAQARSAVKRANHSAPVLETIGVRRFNILTGG